MTEDDPLAFMRGEVPAEKTADGAAKSSFGILVTLEVGPEAVEAKRAKEELMGKALELNGELGGRVAACVVGRGAAEEAKQFVHYGLDGLFALPATHGCLTKDLPGTLAAWAKTQKPDVWLFSDSSLGRRLAARVAMRLETGLVASVTDFDLNLSERCLEMTHLELAGKMRRTLSIQSARPQIATLAPGRAAPAAEDKSKATPIELLKGVL